MRRAKEAKVTLDEVKPPSDDEHFFNYLCENLFSDEFLYFVSTYFLQDESNFLFPLLCQLLLLNFVFVDLLAAVLAISIKIESEEIVMARDYSRYGSLYEYYMQAAFNSN